MQTIRTAYYSGGIKSYGFVSFENLDDLKSKLREAGQQYIGLVQTDPFDNVWGIIESDLKIDELKQEHIDWINTTFDSIYSPSRYLICNLTQS